MKKLAILFFGVFVYSTAAQATTWDFTAEGVFRESAYEEFETGVTPNPTFANTMPTGLTVRASTSTNDDQSAYVYLDNSDPNTIPSAGPGGLGVCKALATNGRTCDPNPDDTQDSTGEYTFLEFDVGLNIQEMVFTGDHENILLGTMLEIFDITHGVALAAINIGEGIAGNIFHTVLLDLDTSKIRYNITGQDSAVYLSSLTAVIPVPAAVWLFGTAMLGLFGLRRKSKMEALAA